MTISNRPVKRIEDFLFNAPKNFALQSISSGSYPGTVKPGHIFFDPATGSQGSIVVGNDAGDTYYTIPLDITADLLTYGDSDVYTLLAAMVTGNTETGISVDWQAGDHTLDFVLAALNSLPSPTGDLSMNTHKITNVVDPTGNQDAATKNYVETRINALINSAPGTLDTLGEIATALASDESAAGALTTALTNLTTRVTALDTTNGAPMYQIETSTGGGATGEYDLTHPFNSRDFTVAVYNVDSPYEEWDVAVEHTSTSHVLVGIFPIPATSKARVVLQGRIQ